MSAARYTSRRTPSRPNPEEWCSDYRGFSALLCHTITRCLVAWGEFVASVRIRIGQGYQGGYYRTFGELGAHHRGRGDGIWCDFIVKPEQMHSA